MSLSVAETRSRVVASGFDNETRSIRTDDWYLPSVESSVCDITTDDFGASRVCEAQSTTRDIQACVAQPVRRSELTIRLSNECNRPLQQWECVVLAVQADCIECEMHDLADVSRSFEYAEIYIEEFSDFDRPLLQEGAVFYWSIGHRASRSGQVRRYSELRVRRLPSLTRSQRQEITQKAAHLNELLGK